MLDRRRFGALLGATALSGLAAPPLITRSFAQGAAPAVARGNYLIKNGAVITVDPALGTLPRADIHVNNGRIEAIGPDLAVTGAEKDRAACWNANVVGTRTMAAAASIQAMSAGCMRVSSVWGVGGGSLTTNL